MRCSRRVPVVLAMMIAVVLGSAGGCGSSARAQALDRLRPEVLGAENLTDEHRQQIAEYLDHWAGRLQNESDEGVTEARRRLLEPLRASSTSQAFTSHYAQQTGERLRPAMDSDRVIVRLNVMIVVTRLSGEPALPLIERGMADDSAAVRYWAIKAVQMVTFANRDQTRLMERLIAHLDRETEVPVAEQTMVALVELDMDEAQMRGLEVLNARVDVHLADPGRSLQAEYAGLQRVYRQLAGSGDPDSQSLRQLARAAVRYQDLAARQLQGDSELNGEIRASYVRMIEVCNATLRFVADNLNVTGTPSSIQGELNQQNWAAIQRNAEQWRALMLRAPFILTELDLALDG